MFKSRTSYNILDLVKQKGFYPYEKLSDFEKSKEELHSKEKSYGWLKGKKIVIFRQISNLGQISNENNERSQLYLKCDV